MENPLTNRAVHAEKVYRIVEKVRCETHLPHKLACHAVYAVIENLSSLIPTMSDILSEFSSTLETPLEAPISLIDDTRDMARLYVITEDLDAVKNDAQQRSWELFDDQVVIIDYLNELNCILMDADVAISKRFLHITDYYIVSCLAEYYQMESRWAIKLILLKTFDLLCSLSKTTVVVLLTSMLPLELCRDIENEHEDKTKLVATIRVLTKLFAIDEPLPVIYFDSIGKKFLLLLLQLIESPKDDPEYEDIVVQLINFILLYNLQFKDDRYINENITIQALSEAQNPKIFSETLLLLFNRARDPTQCLNYESNSRNSLLKMITDIFSNDLTSNLFYNNDVKVLIDIVLRQLMDDSPVYNNERHKRLILMKQILKKTDVSVYKDRISDIQSCITHVSNDDEIYKSSNNELTNEIIEWLSQLNI